MPNEVPLVHYTTSVRVVSLIEENETDISPKYKFFKEQGLTPEKQLPSALIIGKNFKIIKSISFSLNYAAFLKV